MSLKRREEVPFYSSRFGICRCWVVRGRGGEQPKSNGSPDWDLGGVGIPVSPPPGPLTARCCPAISSTTLHPELKRLYYTHITTGEAAPLFHTVGEFIWCLQTDTPRDPPRVLLSRPPYTLQNTHLILYKVYAQTASWTSVLIPTACSV